MKTNKDKKWFCIAISVFLGVIILGPSQASEHVNEVEPTKLEEVIPLPVQKLFNWPAQSVLRGSNRIDSSAAEVVYPKKQCLSWLRKVISPSWLPTEEIEFIFIRDEFDGRDVARISWQRNGYSIQVSQTASIFTIKMLPITNSSLGADKLQKTNKAQQICLNIFKETGVRWSEDKQGVGIKVAIQDLSQKIASYSFQPELSLHLKDDGSVCGRPKDIFEAKIQQPQPNDETEIKEQRDPNNPNWENTAYAYKYWFRMVNWWNDGNSVGFYFLKVEEGAWLPSYAGNIDKNFFRVRGPH